MTKRIRAYTRVLQFLTKAELEDQYLYGVKKVGNGFTRDKVEGYTQRLKGQEIVIADTSLFNNCTSAMWYIVGVICTKLKRYNMLWYCEPSIKKSSTNKIALKKLIELQVISPSEETNIYLVNPEYIRRGDYITVLTTTATMLEKHDKITKELIVDKRAVSSYQYKHRNETELLLKEPEADGYGYNNTEDIEAEILNN